MAGVRASAVGTQLPMIRCCDNRYRVEVEGRPYADPSDLPVHYVNAVTPAYFETFETPIVAGRAFEPGDGLESDPVTLVNVHFAAAYFPGASPVGRRVRLWREGEPGPWRRVVGVAPHLWMDTDVNAKPEGIYVPLAQRAPARASVAIRVAAAAGGYADELREAVARLDAELPVHAVRSMPRLIRDRTSLYRREGPLFALIGIAALVLAVGGLYAVVSYLASLRLAELGVRAALGAPRGELVRRSVAGAALPTTVGAVVGLAVGLGLTRGFDRFVFLVDPWSPWVAAATVAVLTLSALGASLAPALRASRADPLEVLRTE